MKDKIQKYMPELDFIRIEAEIQKNGRYEISQEKYNGYVVKTFENTRFLYTANKIYDNLVETTEVFENDDLEMKIVLSTDSLGNTVYHINIVEVSYK